jgi:hypothetical protein
MKCPLQISRLLVIDIVATAKSVSQHFAAGRVVGVWTIGLTRRRTMHEMSGLLSMSSGSITFPFLHFSPLRPAARQLFGGTRWPRSFVFVALERTRRHHRLTDGLKHFFRE